MYRVQDVEVDPETRSVRRGGREVVLSRKEFDLLRAVVSRAGEVVSRDDLMREVWNTTFWTSSKTIDVHLGWLRRKLGDDPRSPALITTLRGRGLRFELEAPEHPERPEVVAHGGPSEVAAAPAGPGGPGGPGAPADTATARADLGPS